MKTFFFVFLFLLSKISFAQTDSTLTLKKNLITEGLVYGASFYGLNDLWYVNYEKTKLHWYNDNNNWFQLDKVGHATTAYNLSSFNYYILKTSGVSNKKTIAYAGITSLIYLSTIELLDGYSKEWGSSPGDLIANLSGASLFVGQELMWEEQIVRVKFNFYPSDYNIQNPSLLGKSLIEQSIKDYNAQTYWLSFNINSCTQTDYFPDWLNVAFGYGISGFKNVIPDENSAREYYLSLDVDLSKIKTSNKFLKKAFQLFNFIKIPFPAIRYVKDQDIKLYPIYYGQ